MGSHDPFLELCALSTSGELTVEEQETLAGHLAICSSCRERLKEYRAVASKFVMAAPPDITDDLPLADSNWSLKRAEEKLFSRIAQSEKVES